MGKCLTLDTIWEVSAPITVESHGKVGPVEGHESDTS